MQLIMLASLMRSTVPVPIPVSVSSSTDAAGVRCGSHFRCRQTWKPVALFALCNGSTDRYNYNYTCTSHTRIMIIIIIMEGRGVNTLWQRGNWWQSTNKAKPWEPKNLLLQHLELSGEGEWRGAEFALARSTACIRNSDNLAWSRECQRFNSDSLRQRISTYT